MFIEKFHIYKTRKSPEVKNKCIKQKLCSVLDFCLLYGEKRVLYTATNREKTQ